MRVRGDAVTAFANTPTAPWIIGPGCTVSEWRRRVDELQRDFDRTQADIAEIVRAAHAPPRFQRALAIGPVRATLPRPQREPRPPVAHVWAMQLRAARGAGR